MDNVEENIVCRYERISTGKQWLERQEEKIENEK